MLRVNQQKGNFARAAHFFLDISLPLICTTTTSNFQKLPSYMFYGGNVVRALVQFFSSLPLTFTLVAPSISHFLTAAAKFSHSSSKKIFSFVFYLSLSNSLSPFFSLSFAGLSPTFSFSLSCSFSIFQIFGYNN